MQPPKYKKADTPLSPLGRRPSPDPNSLGPGNGLGPDLRQERGTPPMARLVGVDLPRDKRMEIALTYIFGIGRTRSMEALSATGVDPGKRSRDLTDEEIVHLRDYIEANFK